ncbi:invasion associated locus B family protein [Sneathiella sp.]|jgi:invasion protein IalB|uniref:invasion associated locus B family protein n=1 Tax=Sneathiella sp. TaxID=1964365 RepID=UPI0039E43B00
MLLRVSIPTILLGLSIAWATSASAQSGNVWKTVCADAQKAETCRISQQIFLTKQLKSGEKKVAGRVLGLDVMYATDTKKQTRGPYLSISMPLGVDLRPGAVLKIDDGQDISVKYLRCTTAGCDASLPLTPAVLQSMKQGNSLFVGFRAWGNDKVTVLKASLQGFTKSFNNIK